jgi:hypothetical protein
MKKIYNNEFGQLIIIFWFNATNEKNGDELEWLVIVYNK